MTKVCSLLKLSYRNHTTYWLGIFDPGVLDLNVIHTEVCNILYELRLSPIELDGT